MRASTGLWEPRGGNAPRPPGPEQRTGRRKLASIRLSRARSQVTSEIRCVGTIHRPRRRISLRTRPPVRAGMQSFGDLGRGQLSDWEQHIRHPHIQQVRGPQLGCLNLVMHPLPTRRIRFFVRSGWSVLVVVIRRAARQSGCVVKGQLGRAGVAVHGGCVSAVLAQLEYTRRRWSGPPLGLLPQNAGQGEGQG